jgi:small GTP-binding protein
MASNNGSNNTQDPIKVIFVGEAGAGKTNLINVSAGYKFNSATLTTRNCSFVPKTINLNNTNYNLNIWDTIGQEKFHSLTKIFLKESDIAILVYDITNKKSFDSLPYWKGLIDEQLGQKPIYGIVGNKMDLYEREEVDKSDLIDYADKIGAKYLLTSAKADSVSIGKFLETLLADFVAKNKEKIKENFYLDKKNKKKKKRSFC